MHDAFPIGQGHVQICNFRPVSLRVAEAGLDLNDVRAQITQDGGAAGPA